MPHFLDRLVGNPIDPGLLYSDLIAELGHAECILADNVYKYFFEQSGHVRHIDDDAGDLIDIEDITAAFPTIVPPFESTFITANNGRWGDVGGVLFVRRPIMESQHESFSRYISQDSMGTSRLELQKAGVRWMVYALPFVQYVARIYPPYVGALLPIMEDGRWYAGREDQPRYFCMVRDDDSIANMEHVEEFKDDKPELWQDIFSKLMHVWVMPALLTLSFIHCRNVEVIEHDPTPTRQLRRQSQRRQEKTGFPLIRFRTVEIEPVKRVLHEEGRISEVGLAQALHICRGHFKDFREGEGLFGKHHEVYWWNDHRRGTLEKGAILKDYRAPLDSRKPIK
jgi:hypothetical protein